MFLVCMSPALQYMLQFLCLYWYKQRTIQLSNECFSLSANCRPVFSKLHTILQRQLYRCITVTLQCDLSKREKFAHNTTVVNFGPMCLQSLCSISLRAEKGAESTIRAVKICLQTCDSFWLYSTNRYTLNNTPTHLNEGSLQHVRLSCLCQTY